MLHLTDGQKATAAEIAHGLINSGSSPNDLVHILYYPDNSSSAEDDIQGLSNPITPEEHASKGFGKPVSLNSLVLMEKSA